jgi:hypothetical protein
VWYLLGKKTVKSEEERVKSEEERVKRGLATSPQGNNLMIQ